MAILMGKKKERGFTLIELAIVLAVASLLFAGLWRLMASGNTQLRDQATADQHQQLIRATAAYLDTAEGQNWMSAYAANATFALSLPPSNDTLAACQAAYADANVKVFCEYLPRGFTNDTTNAYGQKFFIRVLKDNQAASKAPKSYSFMILTQDGDTIPDASGGRIASMIGNDGGFVYAADVCGSNYACGAFGGWSLSPSASYGFTTVQEGHVASRTFAGLHASQNTPWLARMTVTGSPSVSIVGGTAYDFNTIQADTYMGLVSSTATIANLYGAVSGYGGGIKNLRTLQLGRSTSDPTDEVPLRIVTPDGTATFNPACPRSNPDDASCPYAMTVAGSVSIDGLLQANKLFAGQFIYETDSDERLKKDIKPIQNALVKLGQLSGYSYTMRASGEKRFGVIAQEVEKVFPEIVHKMDSKYIGVDYIGLIGPLVSAVNELRQQNIDLQAKIKAQDEAIDALKKAMEKKEE